MSNFTSPLEILIFVLALGWPFAAGLGVLLWSNTRAPERKRGRRGAEASPVGPARSGTPRADQERLAQMIEALDEAEALNSDAEPPPPKVPLSAA